MVNSHVTTCKCLICMSITDTQQQLLTSRLSYSPVNWECKGSGGKRVQCYWRSNIPNFLSLTKHSRCWGPTKPAVLNGQVFKAAHPVHLYLQGEQWPLSSPVSHLCVLRVRLLSSDHHTPDSPPAAAPTRQASWFRSLCFPGARRENGGQQLLKSLDDVWNAARWHEIIQAVGQALPIVWSCCLNGVIHPQCYHI